MAQDLRQVDVVLLNQSKLSASATGNNAAWHCYCPHSTLLIGRSGLHDRITEGFIVECPACKKARYFVVPNAHDQDRVEKVIEI